MKYDNSIILLISDLHAPAMHPDAVPFLTEIKKRLRPTRVVQIGDEINWQSVSFHPADPDQDAPGRELIMARKQLSPIMKLYPDVDLLDSNHGSLILRKAFASGLPKEVIRSYREVLQAPAGWAWHKDLIIKLPNKSELYVTHGTMSCGEKLSRNMGMSSAQGHYHTEFGIKYLSSPNKLYWAMNLGCLINKRHPAFHYNKNQVRRPIIGCGAVIDSFPVLLPMPLNKHGRWTGKMVGI